MTKEFKEHLGKDQRKTKMGYYIDTVARLEMGLLNAEFDKIGITLPQFRILNWLWRCTKLTQKELHQYVQIQPSSLTTILNVLIKKDLVERQFDENDARVRVIVLTDKSRALEADAWRIIEEFDQKILSILTEDEYRITSQSLAKLLNLF